MVSLIVQMNRRTEQGMHSFRPKGGWITVDHSLQVAQLVRNAKLALSSQRFH
jgi:hypothetical protein